MFDHGNETRDIVESASKEKIIKQQAEQIDRLEVLLATLNYHGFEQLTDCEQEQILEVEAKLKREIGGPAEERTGQ